MLEYNKMVFGMLVAFAVAWLGGLALIPSLRRLKIGQSIREEGPQSHLSKAGTPTMGGLIIFIALIVSTFAMGALDKNVYMIIFSTLGFGLIGFIDDYIIVAKNRNLGLKAYQKIIGQIAIAAVIAIYQSQNSDLGTQIIVPFLKNGYIDLGILYVPFITFVIVGTVNSVNLTDGLDGLATGITAIVSAFFAFIAFRFGMGNISIFASCLVGGCIGFLIHNAYPAKVFMGDTGSMGLGGAISAIAVIMNLPLIIPIVGGIYLIEALSVIIQVLSFKIRGKRVFLMSPIHHHFEQKGWKETKVVIVFWASTVLLAVIGIIALI